MGGEYRIEDHPLLEIQRALPLRNPWHGDCPSRFRMSLTVATNCRVRYQNGDEAQQAQPSARPPIDEWFELPVVPIEHRCGSRWLGVHRQMAGMRVDTTSATQSFHAFAVAAGEVDIGSPDAPIPA
jgi:hypothetical protein